MWACKWVWRVPKWVEIGYQSLGIRALEVRMGRIEILEEVVDYKMVLQLHIHYDC